ncbi:MAG: hypothetical protein ACO34E_17625 [Limisphaerales bacterium]
MGWSYRGRICFMARLEAARNQRRVGNCDYSKGMFESLWGDLERMERLVLRAKAEVGET